MEVTSTNSEEQVAKLNVDIDEIVSKDHTVENADIEKEKSSIEETQTIGNRSIDYDDEEDSGDDIAVITNTSAGIESSPAKNLFSIKTISNVPIHNSYKISKTAIDLEHPGNVNGVPTVDYDLSKVNDDCKPWKKPGADVSDFFNYGFTEESWLHYCEKQRALRLTQDNQSLKTLSGLANFGCNLSGSHIHLGFSRNVPKNVKGGLIDVIGCQQQHHQQQQQQQQNLDYKSKHNDMSMGGSNKISSIPVQTGLMSMAQNPAGNYMAGLASHALLNPLMSAIAMGMLPNVPGNVAMLGNPQQQHHQQQQQQHQHQHQQQGPIETKMSQFNSSTFGGHGNNWNSSNNTQLQQQQQQPSFDRQNSVESTHSHYDYGYSKGDRSGRREDYRSRDKRDRSSEKRRKSRSRSRERGHESKHSRSAKRNRSPDDSRRHKKRSRDRSKDRASSDSSSRRHHRRRSPKKKRHSRSRSHADDRRHSHKSQDDQSRSKHKDKEEVATGGAQVDKGDRAIDTIKREKETESAGD